MGHTAKLATYGKTQFSFKQIETFRKKSFFHDVVTLIKFQDVGKIFFVFSISSQFYRIFHFRIVTLNISSLDNSFYRLWARKNKDSAKFKAFAT